MSVAHALLGLLESGPRHGYDLKRAYDERFGEGRSLAYAQVYSTLSRLRRDGLVDVDAVESGRGGPERKRYSITEAGTHELDHWLRTPEKPITWLHDTMYVKAVLAALSGREVCAVLDEQRGAHLELLDELARRRRAASPAERLTMDHAVLHLEADLRWLDLARLHFDPLVKENVS